jgi:hypothetical protein
MEMETATEILTVTATLMATTALVAVPPNWW